MHAHCMKYSLLTLAALAFSSLVHAQNNLTIGTAAAAAGTITTIAGNGYQGTLGMGGPATSAEMINPNAIAIDKKGNLFISDLFSERIYRVAASTGKITAFAGTGDGGYSGDGSPAKNATFNHPFGVAFDPMGNLYIADSTNNVIRRIDTSTGTISTVIGTGFGAGPGDADHCGTFVPGVKAANAVICNPFGIAIDANGNIFFTSGNQVLKVDASTLIVSVIAGNGTFGYTGDGGPAVSATFSWIPSLALDGQGNLYIADNGNCAIREVNLATNIITSLVGSPSAPWSGNCGLSGDGGPASSALIRNPWGVTVDSSGNIFIVDNQNELVRMISAASGNIYTVAGSYSNGNGIYGYSGDGGPAVKATLANPYGIAADASGDIYFSDSQNFVVRRVTSPGSAIP